MEGGSEKQKEKGGLDRRKFLQVAGAGVLPSVPAMPTGATGYTLGQIAKKLGEVVSDWDFPGADGGDSPFEFVDIIGRLQKNLGMRGFVDDLFSKALQEEGIPAGLQHILNVMQYMDDAEKYAAVPISKLIDPELRSIGEHIFHQTPPSQETLNDFKRTLEEIGVGLDGSVQEVGRAFSKELLRGLHDFLQRMKTLPDDTDLETLKKYRNFIVALERQLISDETLERTRSIEEYLEKRISDAADAHFKKMLRQGEQGAAERERMHEEKQLEYRRKHVFCRVKKIHDEDLQLEGIPPTELYVNGKPTVMWEVTVDRGMYPNVTEDELTLTRDDVVLFVKSEWEGKFTQDDIKILPAMGGYIIAVLPNTPIDTYFRLYRNSRIEFLRASESTQTN